MTNPGKHHHLANFERALAALHVSVVAPVLEARDVSGIIKDYELTYELAWKTLKHALADGGHETRSAREAFERAYQLGWIDDEDVWLAMIKDRNLTVHTYNEALARAMIVRIGRDYVPALRLLFAALNAD